MITDLTAEELQSLLNLEPNATCGFVRVSFTSKLTIAPGGLPAPFAGGQPLGSALYFLVTPEAPVRLHRIRNDQLYHYYLGDPLEVFLLHADGSSERVIVGPDLRGGQRVQLLIPGNTFHTARVIGSQRWFLGASTEWPSVIPADVELGNLDELAARYPVVAADLRAIAASVQHIAPSDGGSALVTPWRTCSGPRLSGSLRARLRRVLNILEAICKDRIPQSKCVHLYCNSR